MPKDRFTSFALNTGFFRSLKWWVMGVTLGIYYVTPWLRWDRGEGVPDQAVLADDDDSYEHAENQQIIADLMGELGPREREIVRLRFFEECSQQEIADRVGVSQMHVSRLLKRSFEQMRERISGDQSG